jgi:hypothetical protein
MTEALLAIEEWSGQEVSVSVTSADIAPFPGVESDLTPATAGAPAPYVVLRGVLGQVEMSQQEHQGEMRGLSFFPVSGGESGIHGRSGFYVDATRFVRAERAMHEVSMLLGDVRIVVALEG